MGTFLPLLLLTVACSYDDIAPAHKGRMFDAAGL